MPLPLLLALFIAFGFDGAVAQAVGAGRLTEPGNLLDTTAVTWTRDDLLWVVGQTVAGVLMVGVFAFLLGRGIAWRVWKNGRASSRVRRAYGLGVRAVDILSLIVYGGIIHELGWSDAVRTGMGLEGIALLDDALILLPFLLAQAAGWWGLYAAEHALKAIRGQGAPGGLRRHLWLKARQSFGMVLPVAALYGLGTDLAHRLWPETLNSPWDQPIGLALMGVLVLTMAPALVRIAWPTRPLPSGPLRDRLEHLAKRVGFRCTDILVWDTNKVVVNAGVTGALPWFRYVLLTDALVENLTPHEIAAVFGHEIGHIAHRHLLYFGFFILGSLGLLSVAEVTLGAWPMPAWAETYPLAAMVVQTILAVLVVAGYFLLVFGFLSRRFERQADVFGCRVVSCGLDDCPPHADLDGRPGVFPKGGPPPRHQARLETAATPLCPIGIKIFVGALSSVAMLNGMQPRAWSWRHGSIVRRIHFLESLEGRPEAERRFQSGVQRVRLVTALLLLAALGAVVATGYAR